MKFECLRSRKELNTNLTPPRQHGFTSSRRVQRNSQQHILQNPLPPWEVHGALLSKEGWKNCLFLDLFVSWPWSACFLVSELAPNSRHSWTKIFLHLSLDITSRNLQALGPAWEHHKNTGSLRTMEEFCRSFQICNTGIVGKPDPYLPLEVLVSLFRSHLNCTANCIHWTELNQEKTCLHHLL